MIAFISLLKSLCIIRFNPQHKDKEKIIRCYTGNITSILITKEIKKVSNYSSQECQFMTSTTIIEKKLKLSLKRRRYKF